MTQFVETPTFVTWKGHMQSDVGTHFVEWQAQLNATLTAWPGFVSLEFISPSQEQNQWLVVQRFINEKATTHWKASEKHEKFLNTFKNLCVNQVEEIVSDESSIGNHITEVIITKVNPDKIEAYTSWSSKIHKVEAQFPGFRGVYIQSLGQTENNYWLTLLQFDNRKNLDNWLNSKERSELLSESQNLVSSMEAHRIISPYAGWFASLAQIGELPLVWKQTMLVLLVLFPIVMLELKFLSPLTANLNLSLATFIGNAFSVTLIAMPMMPIAIWCLGWWLTPGNNKPALKTVLGTLLIFVLYLAEIALFWNFV